MCHQLRLQRDAFAHVPKYIVRRKLVMQGQITTPKHRGDRQPYSTLTQILDTTSPQSKSRSRLGVRMFLIGTTRKKWKGWNNGRFVTADTRRLHAFSQAL